MRSAQHLAARLALFGTVLLAAGCYRPNIAPGGFRCGDGGACPDGFVCDYNKGGFCEPTLSDGGAGKGGVGGQGGQGGKGGQAGRDAGVDRPCLDPVANANCPSDGGAAGLCDPVCNSRCGCLDKCSVDTRGDLTCNPLSGPQVQLLQFCNRYGPQDPTQQSDNCGPGQICVNASACTPGPRCYQFCRGDTDCQNNATCSRDGGSYQYCDVPPTPCVPTAAANSSGTTGCAPGFSCYLSQTGANTLCDCQFDRSALGGTGRTNDVCNHSRDCLAGGVCVAANGFTKQCKAVCVLPVDGGADPCPGGCQRLPGSTTYGWCNG